MDNTILVFQGDNGPERGGNAFPLRGEKSSFQEGGIRVPGFIMGPGIAPGSWLDRHNYIHLVDWLPTLLDFGGGSLNGLTERHDWDGYSFKNVLTGQGRTPRNNLMHSVNVRISVRILTSVHFLKTKFAN